MTSCSTREDNDFIDGSFAKFSKILLKSFILITSAIILIAVKNKYLTKEATLFYIALFIVIATPVLSIIGITDSYIFNNIAVGIGIAVGMSIMNIENSLIQ